LSVLPAGWKGLNAFPTVLTQVFEGKDSSPQNSEDAQYRYDLTGLPRMNGSLDTRTSQYFSRYVEGFDELGKDLMDRGFYLDSIRAFDRALKLNPTYAEPQTYLSQIYSQQKILEAAQLEFEKTIKTHPVKISALLTDLESAQKTGDESRSVTLLDDMIRMNAELADAQYQLSVIYNHQGKTEESKTLLESSIQLNPKQIEAQMTLGHLMSRMGNRLKAEEAFRAVLGIDQENKEAQVELWKLLNKP
jgi:tetratricopeptide (TPR) repeat protein